MAYDTIPAATGDPYQWRESALSTRSLSYHSLADGPTSQTRNNSTFGIPTRKSTLTSIADYTDAEVLAMHRTRQSSTAAAAAARSNSFSALPVSVAESPFFQLPREIREIIYTYVLSSPLGFNFPIDHLDRTVCPQILRTAKILYAEAAPLLYAQNKLIFSHPSDANMFRHALASPHSSALTAIILRVKNVDVKLWTAYFNSAYAERSLVRDYPNLKSLLLRFRGPRFQPLFSQEQNASLWLKDPKLQEVIVSVRQCVQNVRVELCVKVPDQWKMENWESAVVKMSMEHKQMQGKALEMGYVDGEYVRLFGVLIKLEMEGC